MCSMINGERGLGVKQRMVRNMAYSGRRRPRDHTGGTRARR